MHAYLARAAHVREARLDLAAVKHLWRSEHQWRVEAHNEAQLLCRSVE